MYKETIKAIEDRISYLVDDKHRYEMDGGFPERVEAHEEEIIRLKHDLQNIK